MWPHKTKNGCRMIEYNHNKVVVFKNCGRIRGVAVGEDCRIYRKSMHIYETN